MSTHIWLVKQPTAKTVDGAVAAYRLARKRGLDLLGACRFAGYFAETACQHGRAISPGRLWFTASKDNRHAYAKRGNGPYYELAGRRMLARYLLAAERAVRRPEEPLLNVLLNAFAESGEWQPLHDYLEEKRGDPHYGLLARIFAGQDAAPAGSSILAELGVHGL